jgi:hypothetical protein
MDTQDKTTERRDSVRQGGLKSGFAISVSGGQREACVVGNLSETGALLLVEQSDRMPEELVLLVDGDDIRRPAHIVWRRENAVAVSFITESTDGAAEDGWVFPPAKSA